MKLFTRISVAASVLVLTLSSTAQAEADQVWDHEADVQSLERAFDEGKVSKKTQVALNFLMIRGIIELQLHGYNEEAKILRQEWNQHSRAFFRSDISILDLGDWDPMNDWLVGVHENLSEKLGPKVMKFTRLDDIKTFNYGIPVVFHPEDPRWDVDEYRLHFVPFSGAVAYWGTWGACSAGTSGILSMIVCPLAGTAAEKVTVKYVAPKLSDRVYAKGQE